MQREKYLENRNTCLDCKYANKRIYETGQIDDVEYRCSLQNNKMIYDDLHPMDENYDYHDLPECPVDMFEQGEPMYG